MEVTTEIDIYPGDLAIEDAVAVFEVEFEQPDQSVGWDGGYYATLLRVPFGGTALTREQLLLAIGVKAMVQLERDVSDRINDDPHSYIYNPEAA